MFILICKQSVFVTIEYNVKICYGINHGKIYDKFVGKIREKIFENKKKYVLHQTDWFDSIRRENINSMKCNFIILKKYHSRILTLF